MGKKVNNHILNCLGMIMFQQRRQELLTGKLQMKVDELAPALQALQAQLIKANDEIKAQIEVLRNADLPPEAVEALNKIAATTQALDDLNPDAVPEPTPAPEELG